MSAKKASTGESAKPAASANSPLVKWVERFRWVAFILVIVGLFGGLWHMAWQRVRSDVVADTDYKLTSQDLHITPLPAWIHSDLRAEVVRDGSLDGKMSILDPELTIQIKQAFKLHPWIAEVKRVSKSHPASVDVELVYRRPAAMVEVPRGLLPVDAEGVLLPSDDFSTEEAKQYPRISTIKTMPAGPVGTRWQDPRVLGAAPLAAILADSWQPLKLYRVVPSLISTTGRKNDEYTYDLITRAGAKIHWGHGPTSRLSGEATTAEKHSKLLELAKDPNSWDSDPAAEFFLAPAQPPTRTAIKPLPKRDTE